MKPCKDDKVEICCEHYCSADAKNVSVMCHKVWTQSQEGWIAQELKKKQLKDKIKIETIVGRD